MCSTNFNASILNLVNKLKEFKSSNNIDFKQHESKYKEKIQNKMLEYKLFIDKFDTSDNEFYSKFRSNALTLISQINNEMVLNTIMNTNLSYFKDTQDVIETIKSMYILVMLEKFIDSYSLIDNNSTIKQLVKEIDEFWNNNYNEINQLKDLEIYNTRLINGIELNIEYIHNIIKELSKFYFLDFKYYTNPHINIGEINEYYEMLNAL